MLVALLTACVTEDEERNEAIAIVNVGDNVPDFTLHGSDGADVMSSSLRFLSFFLTFGLTCTNLSHADCQRNT
jgi:Na+/H+-translocating membrane pyrophosphatase